MTARWATAYGSLLITLRSPASAAARPTLRTLAARRPALAIRRTWSASSASPTSCLLGPALCGQRRPPAAWRAAAKPLSTTSEEESAYSSRCRVHSPANDEMRVWLEETRIPIDFFWPALLSSGSLCSAIVNGKGDDLVRFLTKTGLAKDTWSDLLSTNSLCSAIVIGEGGDLVRFLTETGLAKDKWDTLLRSNSLCSAIVKGKGDDLVSFLTETGLAKDTWPALLSTDTLCSAILKGKGNDLVSFITIAGITKDKWPALLSTNSLYLSIIHI